MGTGVNELAGRGGDLEYRVPKFIPNPYCAFAVFARRRCVSSTGYCCFSFSRATPTPNPIPHPSPYPPPPPSSNSVDVVIHVQERPPHMRLLKQDSAHPLCHSPNISRFPSRFGASNVCLVSEALRAPSRRDRDARAYCHTTDHALLFPIQPVLMLRLFAFRFFGLPLFCAAVAVVVMVVFFFLAVHVG